VAKGGPLTCLSKYVLLSFGCGISGLPNPVVGSTKSVPKVLDKCGGHCGKGSSGGRAISDDGSPAWFTLYVILVDFGR